MGKLSHMFPLSAKRAQNADSQVRYKDTSDSLIKALNTVRSLETNETSKSTGPRNVNAKNPGGQLKRARRTRDSLMTVTFESIYEEELRLACSE